MLVTAFAEQQNRTGKKKKSGEQGNVEFSAEAWLAPRQADSLQYAAPCTTKPHTVTNAQSEASRIAPHTAHCYTHCQAIAEGINAVLARETLGWERSL